MIQKSLKLLVISLFLAGCGTPNVIYNVDPSKRGVRQVPRSEPVGMQVMAPANPLYITSSHKYHIVKKGENLADVSSLCKIPINKLRMYNNLTDSKVFLGQKIYFTPNIVPDHSFITTKEIPKCQYHIALAGQDLFTIAKLYNLSVLDLVDFNYLESFEIRPEQKIWLVPSVAPKISKGSSFTNDVKLLTISDRDKLPAEVVKKVEESPAKIEPIADKPETAIMSKTLPSPVKSGRVLSNFGKHGLTINKGINIAGKTGDQVMAVDAGKVIFTGEQKGYGNVIVLEHQDYAMSVYAHNKTNLVRSGEQVTKGQPIAQVGQTGRVQTPQLHFEYRIKGKAIDPRKVLNL